jgi:preprotein translocase subunit SecG
MTEKVYWGLAALLAAAIIIAGVRFYQPLLTGLHILVSASLLLVVLLQSGRAADLAGAFGGAGSQTAFGPRGAATFLSNATSFLAIVFMPRGAATFLSNATSFLAIVFMVTSLSLAIFSSGPAATSLAEEAAQTEQTEEEAPAPVEEAPVEEGAAPVETPPADQPPPTDE